MPAAPSALYRTIDGGGERRSLRLVAHGRTNAEIAAELVHLGPGTVKTHVANVQRKLGAANRVGIAAWAWSRGAVTGS